MNGFDFWITRIKLMILEKKLKYIGKSYDNIYNFIKDTNLEDLDLLIDITDIEKCISKARLKGIACIKRFL